MVLDAVQVCIDLDRSEALRIAQMGAQDAPDAEDGCKKSAAQSVHGSKGGLGGRHEDAALVIQGNHNILEQ